MLQLITPFAEEKLDEAIATTQMKQPDIELSKEDHELIYRELKNILPSIHDYKNILSKEESQSIHNYMLKGITLIEYLSPIPDPINPQYEIRNRIFSDGVYAWSEMLLHFVDTYRIGLPKAFREHIKTQNFDEDYFKNLTSDKLMQKRLLAIEAHNNGDSSIVDNIY